jgi:hypothetical protein
VVVDGLLVRRTGGVEGTSGTVTSWEKRRPGKISVVAARLGLALWFSVSEGVGVGAWEAELGRW